MSNIRLIARLDVKGSNLIKGIHLEGLRVLGDPHSHAMEYYRQGIDEILFMDAVASLYGREALKEIVRNTARDIFIPMTVGGGIRTTGDVKDLLRVGADKVAVNTAAVKNPDLIREIARKFGSQCMVLSIEAKALSENKWEVYIDTGRERTGMDVLEWAKRGEELGAGEILLTSVDKEGTKQGFDIPLVRAVSDAVGIPVIASGGMGTPGHLLEAVQNGHADAIAMASILHYRKLGVAEIRKAALDAGINVRAS